MLDNTCVPSLGPLRGYLFPNYDRDLTLGFHEVVDANENWDINKLYLVFSFEILPHVLGVKPPSSDYGDDRCVWRWDIMHKFQVGIAYGKLAVASWGATDPFWKVIWTLPIPRRGSPPDRWIRLNTDATIDTYTSLGSIGGVFRSSAGDWIIGFHKSIGITTPLQAKLWAIYIGLQLAWTHGFDLLQIQSNSLQAIKLLNEANLDRDLFPLVRAISSLCCRSWYTEFL
ncbi:hypothetical protein F3Y22_tig00110160pilonHSYRG00138 [Hibiscus syriacus]|uniref:RNase H type-1 domain-containing protein n=1 Tax=Hibiscus syriacus TaxID=106335 RepID=A0A6A3BF82_HIBSY|nr:hypothetical protein F3Y22_tig00110160pilonHSYRG00138 [Hibiscus syriacus]